MALVIKGSSSGQITVDVPAAAGTNTLTIPAETGNILTNDTTGTIVQVISATDGSQRSRASTSYGSLTLNASITPINSSNKILCLFSGVIEVTDGGRANLCLSRAISGGATTEVRGGSSLTREQDTSNHNVGAQFTFVDSPSTTSATTYTLHGKTENGNTLTLIGGGGISTLTLLEVVA
ncbi:putative molybdenum cofactor biosynthesis protein C [uncultured Mediterranean phage uvMED]|nr:putative molybdenum cofactor biosynthesis protein C [uncultured Mediterranean phage uvMED]